MTSVIWGIVYAGELVCFLALPRRTQSPAIQSIRLYLAVELLTSAAIYLVYSLCQSPTVQLSAYLVDCLLEAGAELGVALGVFLELRGKSTAFGSLQSWALSVIVTGSAVAYYGALSGSTGVPYLVNVYRSFWQVSGFIELAALTAVAFYGALIASAWGKYASLVWLGLAVHAGIDFVTSEAVLLNPSWRQFLKHAPDFAFLATLILWSGCGRIRFSSRKNSLLNAQSGVCLG